MDAYTPRPRIASFFLHRWLALGAVKTSNSLVSKAALSILNTPCLSTGFPARMQNIFASAKLSRKYPFDGPL
jgi:hypothetical protein